MKSTHYQQSRSIIFRPGYNDRYVNSLYFDNLNHEAIKDNLAGITPRHKVRLRWYGDKISEALNPNLEIKIRNGRLGRKILYPLDNIKTLINNKSIHSLSNNLFKELRASKFVHSAINDYLLPMLIVQYQREYYELSNGIRVTLDRNIKYFNINQYLDSKILRPAIYNNYVMELKFSQELKSTAANFMRSLTLTPKRFSKYLNGLVIFGNVVYI